MCFTNVQDSLATKWKKNGGATAVLKRKEDEKTYDEADLHDDEW